MRTGIELELTGMPVVTPKTCSAVRDRILSYASQKSYMANYLLGMVYRLSLFLDRFI